MLHAMPPGPGLTITLTTRGASGEPHDAGSITLTPEFLEAYALGAVLGAGAMGMGTIATHRSRSRCSR